MYILNCYCYVVRTAIISQVSMVICKIENYIIKYRAGNEHIVCSIAKSYLGN